MDETAPLHTAGSVREAVWTDLLRTRACSFPLPPHGHHPNFIGAQRAAEHLLLRPEVSGLRVLVVGADKVLYPLRKLALGAGYTLLVPDLKRGGPKRGEWYWRVTDAAGARLSALPRHAEPVRTLDGAQAVILACVAADDRGGRLGKGFGWGARGLHLPAPDGGTLPEYTLAHPRMQSRALPCPADSRVCLVGTPDGVIAAGGSGELPAPSGPLA